MHARHSLFFFFFSVTAAFAQPKLQFELWEHLSQPHNLDALKSASAKLPPDDPWRNIADLVISGRETNRKGLLKAVEKRIPAPDSFPSRWAENHVKSQLVAEGKTEAEAALAAVAQRNSDSLYALRDLDHVLTRQAEFWRNADREAAAESILEKRDQLRDAWLSCSQHVVERLFALTLLARDTERDELLRQSREIPWLHDPKELQRLLARLDGGVAWRKVIKPLFESEVAFVTNPPKLVLAEEPLAKPIAEPKPKPELHNYFAEALALLEPHLLWHDTWPTRDKDQHLERRIETIRFADNRWGEAHDGGREKKFWTLTAPQHPNVLEAIKMLHRVETKEARDWINDLRRNNTVLTLDIDGGFVREHDAHVLIDARAVDEARFTVYRVREPKDLVWICQRIGRDFVFRDFGLNLGLAEALVQQMAEVLQQSEEVAWIEDRQSPKLDFEPEFSKIEPLAEWTESLTNLPIHDRQANWHHHHHDYYDSWWSQEPDADYFDDECRFHSRRLDYGYHPGIGQRHTSWDIGRIVTVPGEALKEAGAYVLVAEANGQKAYAPLIVDPLGLVLRRCRDGVLTVVENGGKPLLGATIHAAHMDKTEIADENGVAFAKAFAGGDRAIIAHADGRFAIGGYGRVFEGIYDLQHPDGLQVERQARMRIAREQLAVRAEEMGHVYEDRILAAAYTDRPIYRPGQEVHFKLIVRQILANPSDANAEKWGFRDGDFDLESRLELPEVGENLDYAVLDPKKRVVAGGSLKSNEFGTAAGSLKLSQEAGLGSYSLRVTIDEIDRVLPDVFQVDHYRRPHFEVVVNDLPEELGTDALTVKIAARYYFGKPVSGARVEARLVHSRQWRPLAKENAETDSDGKAEVDILPPEDLPPGNYLLLIETTDDSGRTITKSHALAKKLPASSEDSGNPNPFADLPLFVKLGQRGMTKPGWNKLTRGTWEAEVFVYGADHKPKQHERWVNLADYENYNQMGDPTWSERPWSLDPEPVLAMLGRNHAEVGDELEVLVYLPPFEGSNRLLFTIEGRTVVDYHVENLDELSGPWHVARIPIKKRHLPNFYLQARLLGTRPGARKEAQELLDEATELMESTDGSEDPKWCRVDVIDPDALPRNEQLSVAIETDRDVYRPGEQVLVKLSAAHPNGRPADAELSLVAVDASIFAFSEGREGMLAEQFSQGRPPRRFLDKAWRHSSGQLWKDRHGSPKVAEALAMAMEQMAQMQKSVEMAQQAIEEVSNLAKISPATLTLHQAAMPVTSFPLANLIRRDFRETAAWFPQVQTGPDGIAEVELTLPDSLTRFRLTSVGLTRSTAIGTARKSIEVNLPVSAQLFLPRFAMEGDKLEAVAVIHNTKNERQEMKMRWLVGSNATVESVEIPAKSQTRLTRPLTFPQPGRVRVAVFAGEADAEERVLTVQPWGRERTVRFRGKLEAASNVEHTLPLGFVPQTIQISMTREEAIGVSESLEGLRSLLGYPYGCVEQTMSRFLPAVMTQKAIRDTDFSLPADIEQLLPEYIERGLTRLYGFQQPDGGWGWWKNDRSDPRMTAYVLYGLARSRAAGIKVDSEVLQIAVDCVRSDSKISPESWLALAIADPDAVREGLRNSARKTLTKSEAPHHALCLMALACYEAGVTEEGIRIWNRVRKMEMPMASARDLALRLSAQFAYRAPLPKCYETARALTDLRSGYSWGHTRNTSWAIDGLSQILPLLPPPPRRDESKNRGLVRLGSTILLDTSELDRKTGATRAGRRSATFSKSWSDEMLPGGESQLRIEHTGEDPHTYTFEATGVQGAEKLESMGDRIRLHRSYHRLDGTEVTGPIPSGSVIEVRLVVTLKQDESYLLVEGRRPAAFEFADHRIDGGAAAQIAHREFRDDRACFFFTDLPAGTHEIIYYLRAETVGVSKVPSGVVYPMYDPVSRGETESDVLEVQAD